MGEKSPADIARATGKTPGAVSQWLDGKTKSLRADTAAMLERATGYSAAAWIVTGKGQEVGPPAHTQQRRQTTNCTSQIIGNQVHTVCH